MSDTKNVKLGVCRAYFDGVDLGYTKGGVEVSVTTETHKTEVDQFGKTPINENILGRMVSVKVPLAETTLDNLVRTMPGATLVSDGAHASGSVTIATNLTNGQNIVVGGKTLTGKTGALSSNLDFAIGASAAATAANLAEMLSRSSDAVLQNLRATASTNVVTITYGVRGTVGNSITLAAGTAGTSVTVSGANLTGGADVTKARVDVKTGIGVDLLSIAKQLLLHPKAKPDYDKSEDFVVPLAATAGALTFAYQLENERVYSIEFMGYPDNTDKLFYVGDNTAV